MDIATAFFSDEAEASTNRVRVAEYFWRESGKWAQKNPPEGFGGLNFYGRWGQKQGFNPIVTAAEVDERVALEIRRVLLRIRLGKMRKVAARYGRKVTSRQSRPRGRDGVTVFEIDGTAVGPRLIEWAQQVTLDKAALIPTDDSLPVRYQPERIRRLPEIEDAPRDPDLDDEPPWLDQDDADEAAYEAHLARVEAEEAAVDAMMDRWHREQIQRSARQSYAKQNGGGHPEARGTTAGPASGRQAAEDPAPSPHAPDKPAPSGRESPSGSPVSHIGREGHELAASDGLRHGK